MRVEKKCNTKSVETGIAHIVETLVINHDLI